MCRAGAVLIGILALCGCTTTPPTSGPATDHELLGADVSKPVADDAPPDEASNPTPPADVVSPPQFTLPTSMTVEVVPNVLWATVGGELIVPVYLANPTDALIRMRPKLLLGAWQHELDPVTLPPRTSGRFERAVALPATLRHGTLSASITVRTEAGDASTQRADSAAFTVVLSRRSVAGTPLEIDALLNADVVAWQTNPDDVLNNARLPEQSGPRSLDGQLVPSGLTVRLERYRFRFAGTSDGRLNAVAVRPGTTAVIPIPQSRSGVRSLAVLATTLAYPATGSVALQGADEPVCVEFAVARRSATGEHSGYRPLPLADDLMLLEIIPQSTFADAEAITVEVTSGVLFVLAVTVD